MVGQTNEEKIKAARARRRAAKNPDKRRFSPKGSTSSAKFVKRGTRRRSGGYGRGVIGGTTRR